MHRSDALVYLMAPYTLVRQSMRRLFEHDLACPIAKDTGFEATAVWTALREKPDLVVIDCDHPTPEVSDAVQMVPRLQPRARILVLSGATDEASLLPWRGCSLDGFVTKQANVSELAIAVDTLLAGRRHFSDSVARILFGGRGNNGKPALSRREAELLPLLAMGMTLRDAAAKMAIAYKTADSYRTSLLRKLGLRDRVDLARYAIREKIVSP